jgi:anti-sigma factor RsiW
MTDLTPTFTDIELRAYLEGTDSAEQRARIDAALETDDALCERLAALDEWMDALAPAFATMRAGAPALDVAVPPETASNDGDKIVQLPPRRPAVRTGVPWSAALAACLVFAFGGAFLGRLVLPLTPAQPPDIVVADVPPVPPPGWNDAVAAYTRLYTAQTYSGLSPTPEQIGEMLATAGASVGLDLANAAQVDGLRLRHTEILSLDGKPLIKLGYSDSAGEPVTVCVLLRPNVQPDGKPISFRTAQSAGQTVVLWDVQPRGFLVIGRQDEATLRGYAEAVSARL